VKEADPGENGEHINKRVIKRHQQLDQRVRRLVMSHFVQAIPLQPGICFGFLQPFPGSVEVDQGFCDTVLGFLGGTHRQRAFFISVLDLYSHGAAPVAGRQQAFYGKTRIKGGRK
jgi:hypothetical protein